MRKIITLLITTLLLFMAGCGSKSASDNKKDDGDNTTGTKTEESSDEKNSDEEKTDETTRNDGDSSSDEAANNEEKTTDDSGSDAALAELKQAFTEYVNAIKKLAPEEGRLISLYSSVTGENYTDDETLYATLKSEVIPGYNQFVNAVEDILPRNKEIRAAHEQYIEAVNTQYGAFTLILSAVDAQDPDIITEANGKLGTARAIMSEYLNALEVLSEKTGVALEGPDPTRF